MLWEWLVVPFSVKNTPPYFQRRMDEVIEDMPFYWCYIDDIIIWSSYSQSSPSSDRYGSSHMVKVASEDPCAIIGDDIDESGNMGFVEY